MITKLSASEIKYLFREELESFFKKNYHINPAANVSDELLTVKQVSKFLSLAIPTVYSLVQRSGIPFMKQGKRLYFSKQELIEWVKKGKEQKT